MSINISIDTQPIHASGSLSTSSSEDAWLTTISVRSLSIPSLSNMTVLTNENDVTLYTECSWELATCRAQKYLFLVVAPLLIFVSTVGSGLGLAVMTRKSLRNTATAVFISCLAVSDNVAVWTGLSRHFIMKLTKYDIRQYSVWSCRFQRFILYTSLDTSAWILAAVTIERFLAVCMPQKHKLLQSTWRAWKVVIGIIIFQISFNMQVFFNYGPQTVTTGKNETHTFLCGYSSSASREYLSKYHGWVAFAIYCVIPFVVMFTLNIFIIRKLTKMRNAFRKRKTQSITTRSHINTVSMTKMLLTVTFYFMVVTTPAFIFTIIQHRLLAPSEIVTSEQYGRLEVVDAVLTLMLYLNHSINFLLYCVSGRRFKRELIKLLSCRKTEKTNHSLMLNTMDTPLMTKKSLSAQQSNKLLVENEDS